MTVRRVWLEPGDTIEVVYQTVETSPSNGTRPPGSVPAREASEDAKDSESEDGYACVHCAGSIWPCPRHGPPDPGKEGR